MTGEQKATPSLLMLKGETPGRIFEIQGDATLLGRHPDCDITLNIEAVSRRHARIRANGGKFLLEDLGSRNGTHINGKRITAPTVLEDGVYVQICDFVFLFQGGLVRIQDDGEKSSTILGMLDLTGSTSVGGPGEAKPEEKLKAIMEISRIFGATLDIREILEKTLETLFSIFRQADRGFVLIADERSNELRPMAIKFRDGQPGSMTMSRTILDHVFRQKRAVLLGDAGTDSLFKQSESIANSKLRTVLCVPLLDQNRRPIGVLQLDTQAPRGPFEQDDLDLLAAIGSQVSVAVENAKLHEIVLRRHELEQGFRNAREVQKALLPKSRPQLSGFEFWDYYEPAMLVGGDYFDYCRIGESAENDRGVTWALSVGDVAGKGMPAALLMAKLSAEARSLMRGETDPRRIVERLNDEFAGGDMQDRFITFLLVVIDGPASKLSVVSAGHMGPLIRRRNGVVEAVGEDTKGPPLAVIAGRKYDCVETRLEPGEIAVLYTDGVSEAVNSANVQFGPQRLRSAVQSAGPTPSHVGEAILEAVRLHAAGHPQADDITLLAFGRR